MKILGKYDNFESKYENKTNIENYIEIFNISDVYMIEQNNVIKPLII